MRPECIVAAIDRLPVGSPKGRKQAKINHLTTAKLIAALVHEPAGLTYEEMADECGLCHTVLRQYMSALQREGAAYIKAWVEDGRGGRTRKQFALGRGKDAPRPGAKDPAERAVKYRERKKQMKLLGIGRMSEQLKVSA